MGYIALKPCTLQGKTYFINDTIPADAVLPHAEASLIRRGYIASVPDSVPPPVPITGEPAQFTLIFNSDDVAGKKIALTVTENDLQQAGDIMRMSAEDAQKAVLNTESIQALKYVLHLDGRKSVETAVQKKLAEMETPSSEEGAS